MLTTVPPDTAQNAYNRSELQSGALPSELTSRSLASVGRDG